MAKPKKVAAAVEEEEEEVKAEGLEIISIGSLYNGSWEKKYWSSSRGKDRYPYPVGYHAVRAHNGSTCKIEIHDGTKGPLFIITSADGQSCSGQTPDMAWEKFQKKHYPRMKTWHGKRLSCKIDGVEFFGFKNSFIQRLLREQVANVNGTAEKSSLSSSFCNEASSTKHDNQHPDTCTYSDLQAHWEKPKITKKRSRKCEMTDMKPVDRKCPKKPRSQGLTCNSEASNSLHENQRNHKHTRSKPLSTSEQKNDLHEHQEALQASVCLNAKTIEEKEGNFAAKDGFPVVFVQEKSKFAGSENCKSIKMVNDVAEEGILPDRSKNFSLTVGAKDEAGGAPASTDTPGVENVDLCAPDTLDFVQVNADNPSCSSPAIQATANNAISEVMVTDSHLEEEIGTSTSNASSEKSELDSLGQEFSKAMMTVLLPQAIPLLNKVSRKKKVTVGKALETLSCGVDPKEEIKKTSHSVEASFPAAMLIEKTNGEMDEQIRNQNTNLSTVVPSFEHSKSVIPDSYEDDLCGDYATEQVTLSSNMVGTDQSSLEKDINLSNTRKELVALDVRNESSVYHVETDKSKHTLFHDEVHMTSDKNLQEDNVCISESTLSCRSSGKKVLSGKVNDVCANLDKNSVAIGVHLPEKGLKALDYDEDGNDANQRGMSSSVQLSWKDIPAKTAAAETGSSAQVPNKVYSRKKVVPLAEKFNGPLSESIICRNFGDNFVPKTHCPTEALLASKTSQMSSDDKLQKDLCDAEARTGQQSHDLPVISQNSTAFCDSGGKDIYNSYDPSILHIKESEVCSDKELVEKTNLVEFNESVLSQKQKARTCEYNASNAKEVKASSDLKLQKQMKLSNELEGIVELVGCYIHPLPVSSVKLSTIGNEIYICVSCGLMIDKNRTLFIYKLAIQEPRVGCPLFVGHTSVILPFSKDDFGREIELESSCLLFTPDGQSLVLLDSMRTPYCREGRVDCFCSTCASNRFEENAVKLVQVKSGYVSRVAKLKTVDSVQCILVCEPNHLVAVGDSGRLHLWEMNSTWSAHTEEFVIPVDDLIYPCIVELKRILECAHLVVGHNGFGEFGVWDISRRVFLSRFSAPSISTYQFFPISVFSWQRNGSFSMEADMEEHVKGIMDATKNLFLERNENNSFLPSEGKDIAIWLLVQSVSDDARHDYSSDCQTNPIGLWRLALLVKNMVILGSPLDPRAAAVNASAGHGIIGTHDGLVYMWELSTGTKLGTLHDFKGGTISCIATNGSRPRVIAVAGAGGQLQVYLHGRNNIVDHLGGDR
ncbi:hypothetical protein QYF36_023324 [Acer negundo]|nr:hypothetical protein QYF36_023324 [Acer negundo]